jgi:hypothetical protein
MVTLDVFLMIALLGCAGVTPGLGAARYVASHFYQVKATDADSPFRAPKRPLPSLGGCSRLAVWNIG